MAETIGFGPGLICAGHGSPRMTGWPSGVGGAIVACEGGLTRPDLADALPAATVLDAEPLARVAGRARSLHAWLTTQGYTDLHCEIPVLAHTPEGAEIPGTLDLLATGPQGALLIDHKPGGSGTDLGPYWSQLSAYVNVINQTLPACNLRGAAVFWIDHGRLEPVEHDADRPDRLFARPDTMSVPAKVICLARCLDTLGTAPVGDEMKVFGTQAMQRHIWNFARDRIGRGHAVL